MIVWVLQIYIWITILDIILSYIPELKRQQWAQGIHKLTEFAQKPIRDMFPLDIPLDPAPMIVIILCQMLMYLFGA